MLGLADKSHRRTQTLCSLEPRQSRGVRCERSVGPTARSLAEPWRWTRQETPAVTRAPRPRAFQSLTIGSLGAMLGTTGHLRIAFLSLPPKKNLQKRWFSLKPAFTFTWFLFEIHRNSTWTSNILGHAEVIKIIPIFMQNPRQFDLALFCCSCNCFSFADLVSSRAFLFLFF